MQSQISFEQWRAVADYENLYEVSDQGRVRHTRFNRLITPTLRPNGYLRVSLSRKHQARSHAVHRLVAIAFLGLPPSALHQINHRDGDKRHNSPFNLEWVTPSENMVHAYTTGLMATTRKHVERCKRGHEFTPENTRPYRGSRRCRKCEAMHSLAGYYRRKMRLQKQSLQPIN